MMIHACEDSATRHKGKVVQVGNNKLIIGKTLQTLEDSTELYVANKFHELRSKLESDGVILVRNVINRNTVLRARQRVLEHLQTKKALEVRDLAKLKNFDTTSPNDLSTKKTDLTITKECSAIGKTKDGSYIEGWTIDADSGGVVGEREGDEAIEGWKNVGCGEELRSVYNGNDLQSFFAKLFADHNELSSSAQENSLINAKSEESNEIKSKHSSFTMFPSCTWLRVRGQGDLTSEHTDYYYFKQATSIFSDHLQLPRQDPTSPLLSCPLCQKSCADSNPTKNTITCAICTDVYHRSCINSSEIKSKRIAFPSEGEWHCKSCADAPFPFWTCWIGLGDVCMEDGRLALIPGTHHYTGYAAPRNERLPSQFTSHKEKKATWYSADIHPGDIILFNIKTVHAASKNTSGHYRISCDTRLTTGVATSKVHPISMPTRLMQVKKGPVKSEKKKRQERSDEYESDQEIESSKPKSKRARK